jgi:hypothetical protein
MEEAWRRCLWSAANVLKLLLRRGTDVACWACLNKRYQALYLLYIIQRHTGDAGGEDGWYTRGVVSISMNKNSFWSCPILKYDCTVSEQALKVRVET